MPSDACPTCGTPGAMDATDDGSRRCRACRSECGCFDYGDDRGLAPCASHAPTPEA